MKAIWNGEVIAESDKTIVVEGNHYFPPEAVNKDLLLASGTHIICPWKGTASYYSIQTNGSLNRDAAWYYPEPNDAANEIRNYVAFWKGVSVIP
jgi:uncharacterized protein (DUF427 family)